MNDTIARRIEACKRYVAENVPFYQCMADKIQYDVPNFDEFPVITKNDLRWNGKLFLSDAVAGGDLIAEYTSGSTGVPLTLYKTKGEMVYLETILNRNRRKAVANFRTLKHIKFYAELHTGDGDDRCFERIHRENNVLYFSMLCMGPADLDEYIRVIRSEAADGAWIMGPPSVISRFAQYVVGRGMVLDNVKFVEFTGEILFQTQRKVTEEAFHCVTRNHYGSREFWAVAYECSSGKLHILDEHVYVENSSHGLLVSTLDQRTMPLIRYCIGDNCSLEEGSCACGSSSPVLKTFGGRTTEFIRTPDRREISSILLYMIVVNLNLTYHDVICRFRIEQTDYDAFHALLVLKPSEGDKLKTKIRDYFCDQLNLLLGYPVTVRFSYVDEISVNARTGKFTYFVCQIPS